MGNYQNKKLEKEETYIKECSQCLTVPPDEIYFDKIEYTGLCHLLLHLNY